MSPHTCGQLTATNVSIEEVYRSYVCWILKQSFFDPLEKEEKQRSLLTLHLSHRFDGSPITESWSIPTLG